MHYSIIPYIITTNISIEVPTCSDPAAVFGDAMLISDKITSIIIGGKYRHFLFSFSVNMSKIYFCAPLAKLKKEAP